MNSASKNMYLSGSNKPKIRQKADKVGEIFTAAGAAFNKLGELALQLHLTADSPSGGKWAEEDVDLLQNAITQFTDELFIVSDHIKRRTVSQIRATLQKKAFEDAGLPVRQMVTTQSQQGMLGKTSEVTLNMLNAHESEMDVEGMHGEVKLEFGTAHDVTS